ncbi:MAG: hypothetical protein ABL908_14425 [Hyphomicrobium sp.]
MKNTKLTKPTPGRPTIFGERMERTQVMLAPEQREAAEVEAERRGVSVSEVLRGWIDAGRTKKPRRAE